MDFPEGFASPTSSSMGLIFGGSGPVILGRLANRNGSRIGANKNNCVELLPLYLRPIII